MSIRAVVAYERPDGTYDLYDGRGEGLAARITPRTPFGGRGRPVDPVPTDRGVPRENLPERVEFGHHETLVVVDTGYDATAFVALPFGVPDAAGAGGALLEARDLTDEAFLRGWVAGFRGALAAAVTRGLDAGEAADLLRSEARGVESEGRVVYRVGP